MLVSIRFVATNGGFAYEEQRRNIGVCAMAARAVLVTADGGKCTSASISVTNLSDTLIWSEAASASLVATQCSGVDFETDVSNALTEIALIEDNRASVALKMYGESIVNTRAIQRAVAAN